MGDEFSSTRNFFRERRIDPAARPFVFVKKESMLAMLPRLPGHGDAPDARKPAGTGLAPSPDGCATRRTSTVQDNPAASATKELKAAARDALRLGSQWAHTAIQWVDDRRTEMNNRNREQEARERERAQRNRYSTSGYGSDEGDYASERQDATNPSGARRGYAGQSGQGRGDRDIQGHYSQGEYGAGRQGSQGGTRETSQQGYGREGYPQSQSMSPDDFSPRGEYGSQDQSGGGRQWQPGMQGSQGQASQYQGAQAYGSQAYGSQQGSQDYGVRNYDTQRRSEYDQRSMSGQQYGYSDQQDRGFGPQQYTRQTFGSGADPNQARTTGLSGQGYGGQDLSGRASYGSQGGMHGQMDQSAGRYGSMGYRGMGPKNYSRSDERIREDLNERLTDSDEIDASGLSVEVNNGIATLTGAVEQRWMKHLAEDLAESCSGVRDVTNRITVKSQSSSQGMSGASQSQSGQKTSSSTPGSGSSLGASGSASSTGSSGSPTGSSTTSGSPGRQGSSSGSSTT
jgi:osmotically-inducible protein OsmY